MPLLSRPKFNGWFLVLFMLLLSMMGSCVSRHPSSSIITVFAASSLQDVMDEIIREFEQQHDSISIRSSYASSAQLVIQLKQGADADIFASADLEQMTSALNPVSTDLEPVIFATNSLALLVPTQNPGDIQTIQDLAQPEIQLVLAIPGTPLRGYSDQILDRLSTQLPNGPRLRAQILANVVSEEENARQVVAKIALGEADAAFVYSSDAQSALARGSKSIELPPELQIQAKYPIVRLTTGSNKIWAQRFVDFILSPAGHAILTKNGFQPGTDS